MNTWSVKPLIWLSLATIFFISAIVPLTASAAAAPGFTTQPQSQSRLAGTNATFSVVANGQTPLFYQWSFNGTNLVNSTHISGATSTTLIISNLVAGDAGNYQVVVSNSHGTATSSNSVLTVLLPPAIKNQPTNQITFFNGSASFSVSATGTAPLNYRWYIGNAPLSDNGQITGSAAATLNIANVSPVNVGNYQVIVTNNYGSVTSAIAALSATNRVLYVNLSNPTPAPPYTDWNTAATNIQDAVDATGSGDSILVTNGIYSFGNRVTSLTTNCVVVTNAILISSISGATQTIIDGGGTKRCVYLASGAKLTGFTLRNGSSPEDGGGAYAGVLSNCFLVANSAVNGSGVANGTLFNCVLSSNVTKAYGSAGGAYASTLSGCQLVYNGSWHSGGGAGNCTLISCLLSNNYTFQPYSSGGGADGSTLSNCVVIGNTAWDNGGGANNCTLIQSLIISNTAVWGGGVSGGILTNCVLLGNSTKNIYTGGGAGALGSTLYNCLLARNSSSYYGGGAYSCTLLNCTVVNNTTTYAGGGAYSCTLTNCIIYYNNASFYDENHSGSSLNWCCTTPLWDDLGSNISSAPLFADLAGGNYRIRPNSPCVNAGINAAITTATDLDGSPRVIGGTVDLGAYEYQNTPFIEIQPTNQTAPYGEPSLSFSVVAVGPEPLTYQWQFNGSNIGGATNSTLTLSFLQYSNAGTYSVAVANPFGLLQSSNAVLTVVPPTPPLFTLQPSNQIAVVGTNVLLTTLATGAPAPAYRWYFNGSALDDNSHYSGTRTASLQLSEVQTNDTGNYFVIATNTGGALTSLVASVTVLIPPAIIAQPVDQTLPRGSNVTFTVAVSGGAPLAYQWFFNGNPLAEGGQFSGTTTANLTASNLQFTNSGSYSVLVTNPVGSATSTAALLTVLSPPAITLQPVGLNVLQGSNANVSALSIGSAPLNYQWYFNGTPLSDGGRVSGATTTNLTVATTQTNDAGSYQLVVTNNYGAVTSAVALLTVQLPVVITNQPSSQVVLVSSNAIFKVGATGFVAPNYLWFSNGIALANGGRISGANSSTLTLASAQTNDNGTTYQVVVTNIYGSATSSVATLTVYAPVKIIGQPMSQATLFGSNVTFTVTATGSVTGYRWFFNGLAMSDNLHIGGSSTPALTVSNVQPGDAGSYVAMVTNPLSAATSRMASLTPLASLAPSIRYVNVSNAAPQSPFLVWSTAATNIQDAIDAAVAGDTILVTNGIYQTGGRAVYGAATNRVTVDKAVTVQSINGPATTTIAGFNNTPNLSVGRCVYATNGALLIGFTLTNGGSGNSGDLILEQSGGGVWCESSSTVISNCVLTRNFAVRYGGGAFRGTLFNCIVTNNIASQGGGVCSNTLFNCTLSKNFAQTQNLISGGGAYGCSLSNCLIVGNFTSSGGGGGAALSTLTGCVLSNNVANSGGALLSSVAYGCLVSSNRALSYGGGAYGSSLVNCILRTNWAGRSGGGTYGSALTNCTIVANSSVGGGGVDGAEGGVVANSIVYNNVGGNIGNTKAVFYVCSTPNIGTGGFTNAPLFVNEAGGDFHLQAGSPCINAGHNAYASVANDFDGNPRIVGGTVDIGAYEFQSPSSVLSYAWAQQYGVPTDGSADYADPDGDGMNNWQECKAYTIPTNSASLLQMASLQFTNSPTGIKVTWKSVLGVPYFLQRSVNLSGGFATITNNLAGLTGTTTYTDTTATNGGPYFYRVGVQ